MQEQCIRYANKYKIKYIINAPFAYGSVKDIYGFPSFSRSFGIAGFTVLYPLVLNPGVLFGCSCLANASRYNNRMIINSAVGL
jgi:hypothetical protein